MERDAEVMKLRAETARIYRRMQLDRDVRLADTLETGEQNAEQDLSAMSTAFSLQSGDEWIPPQAAARRATLIGAPTVSRTVRLNSAAPTPTAASAVAPAYQPTVRITPVRRLPYAEAVE